MIKVKPNYKAMFVGAIAAGASIGLTGAASLVVSSITANPMLANFLKASIFPIGLILIVLCNFKLFTGAVALLFPLKFKDYVLSLLTIWIGNFMGATGVAAITSLSLPNIVKNNNEAILNSKCYNANILLLILFGVCCNFLICLGVKRAAYIKETSNNPIEVIALLFIVVFMFVICGFEHSIANMYYIPFAMFCNKSLQIGWLFFNLIPVTIGNILGGLLFVLYDNCH